MIVDGVLIVALFVLLLPANIYEAVADVSFANRQVTPLWQRIPEQLLYIAVALWVARSADSTPVRRLLTAGGRRPRQTSIEGATPWN
jgi:uncharacterized membrane protein